MATRNEEVDSRVKKLAADFEKYDDGGLELGLYIFELRSAGSITFLPLIINPRAERLDEVFSVTLTPGLEGSLYAEENGIVERQIMLAGTTGLKHKAFPKDGVGVFVGVADKTAVSRAKASHSRPHAPFETAQPQSGVYHFRLLQDRIFRDYADLKRDPVLAENTELYLHVTRDREFWRVIPRRFSMIRGVPKKTLYSYEIHLTAVGGGGDKTPLLFGKREDDFGKEPSASKFLAKELAKLSGAFKDLGVVTNRVKTVQESTWMTKLRAISQKAHDFIFRAVTALQDLESYVRGAVDAILSPYEALITVIHGLDSAIDELIELGLEVMETPIAIVREIRWGAESIMSSYDRYGRQYNNILNEYNKVFSTTQRAPTGVGQAQNSLEGLAGSTAPLNGDPERDQFDPRKSETAAARSVRTIRIRDGATIQGIAGRELGNPDRWPELAALNDLQPPFFSETGLPGTLKYGSQLLIPDPTPPPDENDRLITLGLKGTEPLEERLYGRDFLLKEVAPGRYDWDLNDSKTDFRTVAGIANLSQGLTTRILTARRSVPLLPEMGTDDVIGSLGAVQNQMKRVSILRSVQQDPRVLNVPRVDLSGSSGDTLEVTLGVVPYGLVQRLVTSTKVPV